MGFENDDLPEEFRDKVIAETPQTQIGAVKVTKMGGVKDTSAARTLRKLEESSGRADLVEALSEGDKTEKELTQLVEFLKQDQKTSLAFIAAKTRTPPTKILSTYAKGLAQLKRMEALLEAYQKLPMLVSDIMHHAIDFSEACPRCEGTGKIEQRKPLSDATVTRKCGSCRGNGLSRKSSEHKQWAAKAALEMTKLIEKEKGVNVNVGVAVQGGGDFMSKILNTSDAILQGGVVDVTPEKKEGE